MLGFPMLIPISRFLPPLFFPLGVHTVVLYVCVSGFFFASKIIYTILLDSCYFLMYVFVLNLHKIL